MEFNYPYLLPPPLPPKKNNENGIHKVSISLLNSLGNHNPITRELEYLNYEVKKLKCDLKNPKENRNGSTKNRISANKEAKTDRHASSKGSNGSETVPLTRLRKWGYSERFLENLIKFASKGPDWNERMARKKKKGLGPENPELQVDLLKEKMEKKKSKKISWGVSHKSGPKIQRQRNNVIVSKENIEKKVGTKHKKLLSPLSSCSSSSFFLFFNLFISFNFFYLLFAEEGAVLFDIYAWAPAP